MADLKLIPAEFGETRFLFIAQLNFNRHFLDIVHLNIYIQVRVYVSTSIKENLMCFPSFFQKKRKFSPFIYNRNKTFLMLSKIPTLMSSKDKKSNKI